MGLNSFGGVVVPVSIKKNITHPCNKQVGFITEIYVMLNVHGLENTVYIAVQTDITALKIERTKDIGLHTRYKEETLLGRRD